MDLFLWHLSAWVFVSARCIMCHVCGTSLFPLAYRIVGLFFLNFYWNSGEYPPFSGQQAPSREAFGTCLSWKVQSPSSLLQSPNLQPSSLQLSELYSNPLFRGVFCKVYWTPKNGTKRIGNGTGNFSDFWWYKNWYWVPEKSLETGIGKKSRNRYQKRLVPKKSTGIRIRNIWYRKK